MNYLLNGLDINRFWDYQLKKNKIYLAALLTLISLQMKAKYFGNIMTEKVFLMFQFAKNGKLELCRFMKFKKFVMQSLLECGLK